MRVLLTGPSGRIGPHLVGPFQEKYDLRLFDLQRNDSPAIRPNVEQFVGNLTDIAALQAAMEGVEVVAHLAATSDEAPFIEQLVPNNVIGMFNVLEAARECGVRRVVFASSIQAFGRALHGDNGPVETNVNHPNSLYGVTKIMGEQMGQWFHDKHGLEFVALRLGWVEPDEKMRQSSGGIRNIWLSMRDAARLFICAIDAPDIGFAIVNGTSKTGIERMSLRSAREILGYEPQDVALEG